MPDDEQRGMGYAFSLGIEIAAGVGLGLWVGHWLDRKYGWEPWGTLLGSMLGLAGGLYLVIKTSMRINKD